MGNTNYYDWEKFTREFVEGSFENVKEYIEWSEDRVEKFGEERPSRGSIVKASARYGWVELKEKKELKAFQKIVDGAVNHKLLDKVDELAEMELNLTRATISLIVQSAKNPQNIDMKADLSDLINDAKRSLGLTTKEQQESKPVTNIQQGTVIQENSRRKEIEELSEQKRKERINKSEKYRDGIKDALRPEGVEVEDDM